jgi:hypothetical protein
MSIRKYDPNETPAVQVHRWFNGSISIDDCVRALIAGRD